MRLGLEVEVRGGLVEHQDAGFGHEGAPEGDELALARGQRLPALVDRGVEAVGEPVHQLAQPDLVDGVPDLVVGGAGPGERDVVPDGPGEEEGLLGHDAELRAQRGQRHALEVVAVDEHPARRRVVEAGDQLGHGRLAGPGGADEGHRLPGRRW